MATQNPYSGSLLMDAVRGSLSNAESLGRGFAVAPVGLLGDINALARQYITPRLPQRVQGLLQAAPAAPTTEQILSNIPRVSAARRETAGMEQLGAAMNPRGPVELAQGAGRLAGNAVNEAMVYGRGPLAGITPQPIGIVERSKSSFTYPQEEALRLAQQRAALPVEQFGLGLPPNNTAQQRAAAMFPDDVYHATKADFTSIRPSATGKMGQGVYTSFDPSYAERYASGEGAQTMPLVTSGKMATPELKSDVSEVVRQEMIKENPDFNMREWKRRSNQGLADMGYSGLDVDKERLIFNPEDLRSRFAAFDPWRCTAATAALMGVAAPDLLAQEQPVITQQQIDDELAKYGLLGR